MFRKGTSTEPKLIFMQKFGAKTAYIRPETASTDTFTEHHFHRKNKKINGMTFARDGHLMQKSCR